MTRPSRTTEMAYEQIAGYAPPAALPPLDEVEAYVREYAAQTRISIRAARWLFRVSGMDRRVEQLRGDPADYEHALRDVPARIMVSNALMFSATAVLRDEDPAPDPLDRAARLIAAARSFYADLLAARLPADTFHGAPMEMGQYRNLFSTCNYPSGACLEIYKSQEDSYFVVVVNGCFYKVAFPADAADWSALRGSLAAIAADAQTASGVVSPGPFSAAAPPQRAIGFTLLRMQSQNRDSLEVLANAFLVLCLDLDSRPADEEEACRLSQSRNRHNRWYLSSNQMVVFGNAKTAITFSYICGIDGNVMTRFSSEVRRRALQLAASGPDRKPAPVAAPERLRFAVPAALARWADDSCRGLLSDDRVLFRIRDWGGEELLRRGLHLDSVFNIAMLMAEERLAGRRPVHVELLTMAKYKYRGLGDAVPWSPAVSRLADPACDAASGKAAAETLCEAMDAHRRAIRAGRERFNLSDLFSLHLALSPLWKWPPIVFALMNFMSSIDVIVSFPHPSEDIAVVGRIGVRLLTRLFSLHYETSAEEISVAFMPAFTRGVPPQKAYEAFEESLQKVVRIAKLLPEKEDTSRIRVEKAIPIPSARSAEETARG
jgi:hypothetical protein